MRSPRNLGKIRLKIIWEHRKIRIHKNTLYTTGVTKLKCNYHCVVCKDNVMPILEKKGAEMRRVKKCGCLSVVMPILETYKKKTSHIPQIQLRLIKHLKYIEITGQYSANKIKKMYAFDVSLAVSKIVPNTLITGTKQVQLNKKHQ